MKRTRSATNKYIQKLREQKIGAQACEGLARVMKALQGLKPEAQLRAVRAAEVLIRP